MFTFGAYSLLTAQIRFGLTLSLDKCSSKYFLSKKDGKMLDQLQCVKSIAYYCIYDLLVDYSS